MCLQHICETLLTSLGQGVCRPPRMHGMRTWKSAYCYGTVCILHCTLYHQDAAAWNAARWCPTEGTRAAVPSRQGRQNSWLTAYSASGSGSLSWATGYSARCRQPSRPCLLSWHSSTCAAGTALSRKAEVTFQHFVALLKSQRPFGQGGHLAAFKRDFQGWSAKQQPLYGEMGANAPAHLLGHTNRRRM